MSDDNPVEYLSTLSYEQLVQLPPSELVRLTRAARRQILGQLQDIGAPGYQRLTWRQRVEFWIGELHRQMRWQAEAGLDPYLPFSREWHEAMRRIEPDFDALIDAAFAQSLGAEWDRGAYEQRIRMPL